MSNPPDTIVLIHGFWVTPRSWEDWIAHYEPKGFTVLAPAYSMTGTGLAVAEIGDRKEEGGRPRRGP